MALIHDRTLFFDCGFSARSFSLPYGLTTSALFLRSWFQPTIVPDTWLVHNDSPIYDRGFNSRLSPPRGLFTMALFSSIMVSTHDYPRHGACPRRLSLLRSGFQPIIISATWLVYVDVIAALAHDCRSPVTCSARAHAPFYDRSLNSRSSQPCHVICLSSRSLPWSWH